MSTFIGKMFVVDIFQKNDGIFPLFFHELSHYSSFKREIFMTQQINLSGTYRVTLLIAFYFDKHVKLFQQHFSENTVLLKFDLNSGLQIQLH